MKNLKIYGRSRCGDGEAMTPFLLREELRCDSGIAVTPFDVSDTVPAGSDFLTATPGEAVELLRKAMNA